MKNLFLLLLLLSGNMYAQYPLWDDSYDVNPVETDWLVDNKKMKAGIYQTPGGRDIVMYNGLVKRSFRLTPDAACTDYRNMYTGQQLLRSVKPEARININGKDYMVGGLYGQKENAYLLPEWIDTMQKNEKGFNLTSYLSRDIEPALNWKTGMWIPELKQPAGKRLIFYYDSSLPELAGIVVSVHYEIYDGIPLICKYVEIENRSQGRITVNRVVNEILGMVEEESAVFGSADDMRKPSGLYIESDYAFNNSMQYRLSDQTTHWKTDSAYTSQVNYDLRTPCVLEVYPEDVAGIELGKGEHYRSVRTYELMMDGYDRERRGLAIRKMYRAIAPWVTANPIFMHVVTQSDEQVYTAIDQCAETGYEAIILSFGSHISIETNTPENHAKWKKIAGYAHSKGIRIGGYTLFSSRTISPEADVINPKTGKTGGTFFNNAPCFGSQWGLDYARAIIDFFDNTGFDILEMDGPYPGDVCASTSHPGHRGAEDSQWAQMQIQKDIFHRLNEKGVYINAPDWYFLDGTNKVGLGYREVNFSLSREQQKILNRQNIFDGTWEKTPSMGWGFVPLTVYQGGGADAILEPLSEHLKDYKDLMVQYYGAGIQACYRGPRLYDTEETKQTVIEVIDWYKKYREILNADIIHLRRADGRDWDGILHVDPALKEKGFAILYNPTTAVMTRTIKLPLYYTGLTDKAIVSEKGGTAKEYNVGRDYSIDLTFTIEPKSYTWFVIE